MTKKKYHFSLVLLIFMMLVCPFPGEAESEEVSEYMLKAVFLERFARFVEWPEGTIQNDASHPFIISVFGGNPFNSILDNIYSNRKIKNRLVKIKYISEPEDIKGSNILFIATSNLKTLDKIISTLQTQPVLIVSDKEGYGERNVHINIYNKEKKYPFEVNFEALQKAGLKMDCLLLDMAKIITPLKNTP
jgi:hypothetical protein